MMTTCKTSTSTLKMFQKVVVRRSETSSRLAWSRLFAGKTEDRSSVHGLRQQPTHTLDDVGEVVDSDSEDEVFEPNDPMDSFFSSAGGHNELEGYLSDDYAAQVYDLPRHFEEFNKQFDFKLQGRSRKVESIYPKKKEERKKRKEVEQKVESQLKDSENVVSKSPESLSSS